MKNRTKVLAVLVGAAALGVAVPAAAQSILLPATPEKGIWLEVAHPEMEMEVSRTSSVWFLSGRLPVSERLRVIADLPYAYGRPSGALEQLFGDESSQVIGNPLLGIEYLASPALRMELSARAPLTTADETSFADAIGVLGEPLRSEAFFQDVIPVTAALEYARPLTMALDLRLRGGATALFVTDDAMGDSETAMDYGMLGTYTAGAARLGLGVSGRWFASADEGSFSDNSLHQLGASADMQLRGVRPGVTLRVPLDEEYREVVKYTVGLYLQVPLR